MTNEQQRLAAAFEAGTVAYERYLSGPAGRLRQEIVWAGLQAALLEVFPDQPSGLTVLDAGAGTGTQAAQLLAADHRVWLVDLSTAMLERARQRIATLGAAAAGRAIYLTGPIERLPEWLGEQRFDLVLCHTVLEFVDAPAALLDQLAERVAPGGLLSVTALNRAALPLHLAAVRREWSDARAALMSEEGYDGLFGLRRLAFEPDWLYQRLAGQGLSLVSVEGVRILDNLLPTSVIATPTDYAAVLALELAMRRQEPYWRIGRYSHLLMHRPAGAPG